MSRPAGETASLRKAVGNNRIHHTRWLVVLLLPLIALTAPPPDRAMWMAEVFESLGIFCLLLCVIGRGWTSVYISGRKNRDLIMAGPFSIVRNPLYVFSFIGVIGIGLISEMVTFMLLGALVFGAYYAIVVRNEEAYLADLHGKAFADYRRTVPRWIPKFSLWRDAPTLVIEPRALLVHLRDSAFFFVAFFFFEGLEYLREFGGLKPWVHLP